jgi:hypothetical protein
MNLRHAIHDHHLRVDVQAGYMLIADSFTGAVVLLTQTIPGPACIVEHQL